MENKRKATAKAYLIRDLLKGKKISIRTAFYDYGISNLSRELIRSVEKPFEISVNRTPKTGRTRYGKACYYFEYQLNVNDKLNKKGVKNMKKYLSEVSFRK